MIRRLGRIVNEQSVPEMPIIIMKMMVMIMMANMKRKVSIIVSLKASSVAALHPVKECPDLVSQECTGADRARQIRAVYFDVFSGYDLSTRRSAANAPAISITCTPA